MALKTFEVRIRLKNGVSQLVRVQAENVHRAKDLVVAQYGKECAPSIPKEVKR